MSNGNAELGTQIYHSHLVDHYIMEANISTSHFRQFNDVFYSTEIAYCGKHSSHS